MLVGSLFLWWWLYRGKAVTWRRALCCVGSALFAMLSALFTARESGSVWLCYALFLVLVAIVWIDAQHLWIPDTLVVLVVALGSLLRAIPLQERLLCTGVLGGSLWLLCRLWRGCIGWGDVKLCSAAAFALGRNGFCGLSFGVIAAGAYAILLLWKGRARLQTKIPFGPWIVLGIAYALWIP